MIKDKKARKAVEQFFIAWQTHKWVRMLKATQLTWRTLHSDCIKWLKSWFGLKDFKGFEIIGTQVVGDACTDVFVNINYGKEIKKIRARVICERAAYKPDIKGKWGVNPISCLKEK